MLQLIDGSWLLSRAVDGLATRAPIAVLDRGECVTVTTVDPFTGQSLAKTVCSYPDPGCKKKKKKKKHGSCGCGGGSGGGGEGSGDGEGSCGCGDRRRSWDRGYGWNGWG